MRLALLLGLLLSRAGNSAGWRARRGVAGLGRAGQGWAAPGGPSPGPLLAEAVPGAGAPRCPRPAGPFALSWRRKSPGRVPGSGLPAPAAVKKPCFKPGKTCCSFDPKRESQALM